MAKTDIRSDSVAFTKVTSHQNCKHSGCFQADSS